MRDMLGVMVYTPWVGTISICLTVVNLKRLQKINQPTNAP